MPNLAVPLLIMLLLTYAESIYQAKRLNKPAPWTELVFNLNSGHVVMWSARGLEIVAYAWVFQNVNLNWVSAWPVWLQWLVCFVAWDFCFYWMHRMHHKIPLLWAIHLIHHQGEQYNLSLGIRNSWYSSLSNFPFIAGLAVLGFPVEMFVVVSSIHYSVQFYNHNCVVGRSGVLDKILVTPLNHRVHHGMDAPYIDKNFGGTLLIWDRIFKSFQVEVEAVALRFGVKNQPHQSNNPFWASNYGLFNRYRVKSSAILSQPASEAFMARTGFILFLTVIYYVLHEQMWSWSQQLGLFTLILWALLALGTIADRKKSGWWLWIMVAVMFPAYLYFSSMTHDYLNFGLCALWLAHLADCYLELHNREFSQ